MLTTRTIRRVNSAVMASHGAPGAGRTGSMLGRSGINGAARGRSFTAARSSCLGFDVRSAVPGLLENGAGRHDVGLGWLQDRVAVAADEVPPRGAEVDGVVVFGVLRGAAQPVDLRLCLAGVLPDPVDLLRNLLVRGGWREAERLLPACIAAAWRCWLAFGVPVGRRTFPGQVGGAVEGVLDPYLPAGRLRLRTGAGDGGRLGGPQWRQR